MWNIGNILWIVAFLCGLALLLTGLAGLVWSFWGDKKAPDPATKDWNNYAKPHEVRQDVVYSRLPISHEITGSIVARKYLDD